MDKITAGIHDAYSEAPGKFSIAHARIPGETLVQEPSGLDLSR
jgi:hypothetical protein